MTIFFNTQTYVIITKIVASARSKITLTDTSVSLPEGSVLSVNIDKDGTLNIIEENASLFSFCGNNGRSNVSFINNDKVVVTVGGISINNNKVCDNGSQITTIINDNKFKQKNSLRMNNCHNFHLDDYLEIDGIINIPSMNNCSNISSGKGNRHSIHSKSAREPVVGSIILNGIDVTKQVKNAMAIKKKGTKMKPIIVIAEEEEENEKVINNHSFSFPNGTQFDVKHVSFDGYGQLKIPGRWLNRKDTEIYLSSSGELKIDCTMQECKILKLHISLTGNGNIVAEGSLITERLKIINTNNGIIKGFIASKMLNINCSNGKVEASCQAGCEINQISTGYGSIQVTGFENV